MIKADIFSALIQCNEVMQQNILPPPQDRQYQEIIIFVIYDDDYYYYHYYHYYHWLLGAVHKWRHHFRWVSLQTTHVLRVHCILSIHGWSEVKTVDTRQKWWRHLWTVPYPLLNWWKLRTSLREDVTKEVNPKTFQTVNIYLPETFDSGNEVSQFCPINNTVTVSINPFFSH